MMQDYWACTLVFAQETSFIRKRTVKPPVHLLLEASCWVRTDLTYSPLRCRVSFRPGTGPNVQHPAGREPLGQGTAGSHARAPCWVGPPCEHPNVC